MITAVVYYSLGILVAIEMLKDHRITEWLKLEVTSEGHVVQTPAQTGPSRASLPGLWLDEFWILPWRETPQPPWGTYSNTHSPLSKKVFPDVQRDSPLFTFVSTASDPVTGHNWNEPSSVLSALSFKYLHPLVIFLLSLLFSRQESQRSQLFCIWGASVPQSFLWPFTELFLVCSMTLLYWGNQC